MFRLIMIEILDVVYHLWIILLLFKLYTQDCGSVFQLILIGKHSKTFVIEIVHFSIILTVALYYLNGYLNVIIVNWLLLYLFVCFSNILQSSCG